MSAWFLVLFFAGLAVALLWAWIPHALGNYRATHDGICGTVTVPACALSECHARFDSEDGQLHLDNVDVVSIGANFRGGRGARARRRGSPIPIRPAHTNEDWLAGSVGAGFWCCCWQWCSCYWRYTIPARPRWGNTLELAGLGNPGAKTGSTQWTGYL